MGSARSSLPWLRHLSAHVHEHALRIGVVLSIALGVLTACVDLAAPTTPSVQVHAGAKFEMSCPSNVTVEQCTALQDAIANLKNSGDAFCSSLGSTIEGRFNRNEIVYDPNTSYYGYVYGNGDSNIYLGPIAFGPGELANTLAHEESHLSLGYEDSHNGSSNDAYAAGDRCAGSI